MSILKSLKWFFIDQFMFHMSGGGGGGSTTSTGTTYTTNIPEYAQPYVMSMLGAGQRQLFNVNAKNEITGFKPYKPYSTDVNDYFASASPMQQQAYAGAANLQTPGQFQAGSDLAGAGALGSLGVAGQAGNAGNQYFGMATNAPTVGQFMNPYLMDALNPALAESRRQYGITGQQQQSQATGAGAFGGSREALMAAENNRNMNTAMNQMIGQGYQNAYNQAQQNILAGNQLGLQGQQAALQGYGQGIQGAGTLGQLGQQQLAAQQGIINMQNQFGSAQQQAEQAKINQAIQDYATAQQYPMLQLANMNALLRGLPLQNTTTQTYMPTPGAAQTLGGIGLGAAGIAQMFKAKGGTVKSYADGGITSLANRERLAEKLNPQQLQQVVQDKTIPAGIAQNIQQDNANMAQRYQMAQAAQDAQAIQTAQNAVNEVMPGSEVTAAHGGILNSRSGLPSKGFAEGGIIAFANRGLVPDVGHGSYAPPTWDYSPDKLDFSAYEELLKGEKNPLTGQPYTREEIAERNRKEEQGIGIKDYSEARQARIDKQREGLESDKSQALGKGFLAASQALLSKPGVAGIGQALGDFGTTYGAGLKEVKATERDIDRQEMAVQDAQQAMLQARLTGDRSAYNDSKKEYNAARLGLANAQNENVKATNAAKLAGAEQQYGYRKAMDVAQTEKEAKIAAAAAGNPSKIGMNLNTMVKDRENSLETITDKWKTSDEGKAYQKALTYKQGIAKDKWDPENNKDHALNERIIAQGDKVLSDLKKRVYAVHNPMIEDQWNRNNQYGSNTISKSQLGTILNPEYNAGDVDRSNPLLNPNS